MAALSLLAGLVAIVLCGQTSAFILNDNHAGFNHDGHVEWRDCASGDKWVTLSKFDLSPKPLALPGNVHVTFLASIAHELSNQVTLNVTIEKGLLGRWTKVPCTANLGTCFYDDPCKFLNVFASEDSCPQGFIDSGLPCSCPFSPAPQVTLTDEVINVPTVDPAYSWLASGKYHVKAEMFERSTGVTKGCVEAYVELRKH
ncbi:ganglioside GM2 activator-like [Babylonia areolata]|uniref:ganglioside GM2 activator-like n=1 Tax=Babylonia areolata TaxID=304850 RepID=UPI003FD30BFF